MNLTSAAIPDAKGDHKTNQVDVLFCMNNFAALGIQRAICGILNNWDNHTYGNVLLSVHNRSGELLESLDSSVPVVELDGLVHPLRGIATAFRLAAYLRLLRRYRPRVVFAVNQFEALCLCAVKRFYPDFRLVVSENCHVSSNLYGADRHRGWFGAYYRGMFRREYSAYADIVHTVAEEAADDLVINHGIDRSKIRVIYNPVDIHSLAKGGAESVDHEWLGSGKTVVIAASRLAAQKRIDVLLKAWRIIMSKGAVGDLGLARLLICGDGELRAELAALTERLGIADSVRFVGFQSNPWKWISKANLFVSTSEWEGLPCSLIEAQALGIPVVSSDCPSGPKEILCNGRAGYLFKTGSVEDCAQKLAEALADGSDRRRRAAEGTKHLARFEAARIASEYGELARSLMRGKPQ